MDNDWEKIKKNIYFLDGSLRDIYINNITKIEWKKWINHVNKNYKINWINNKNKIDFEIVKNNWEKDGASDTAIIFIENVQVKCHFFCDFENDIDPNEIKSIYDHNCIINYMKDISKVLDKVIYLSAENARDNYLIKIYKDEIYGI
jgi:hypothetical protein